MLVPQPPSVADTGWDKLNHVLAFAGPMFAGLAAQGRPGRRAALVLAAALLAWGGGLELLQSLLPPRQGDLADWLADAIGIAAGAAAHAGAGALFRRRMPR